MKRALVTLLALVALPLLADEKRFSLEDILGAPYVHELIAAKGRIAWIANDRGSRNVWTAQGPKWEPRQLTKFNGDDGVDVGELTFSVDGQWLAFTRGGDLEIGAEAPNPASVATPPEQQVWTISLRDGAVHTIAEGRHPAISPRGDRVAFEAKKQIFVSPIDGSAKPETLVAATGSRDRLRWSPDASMLAFETERRQHSFVGVVDIASKSLRYLDPSVDRDAAPVWLPDGKSIAFVRIASEADDIPFKPQRTAQPWSIRVADATTGRGRELFRAEAGRGSAFRGTESDEALWIADDRIVFPWEKDGWVHLYSIPIAGGAPRLLTPGDYEVQHVAVDGTSIVFSSNENDIDRRHLWRVAADGSTKPVAITSGKTIEWSPVAVDAKTVAFIRSDATHPGRVYVNDRAVSPLPPTFPTNLTEPQQVIFSSSDGLPIHAQLFLPHDAAPRHPAAVFFHGGSQRQMLLGWHYMEYYSNAYAMNQYLASRGYVVLAGY